jgi:alcohol dehydrogenase class IV
VELRKFVAPECVFGADARRLAATYAGNLGARRVLVVTDPGVESAGWTGDVLEDLDVSGIERVVYHDVTPNPRTDEVMRGAGVFRREQCDCIIAIGGGSPIDCAKGIGIVFAGSGHILDYEGIDQVRAAIPPLICVPTTGGSSADVSQFAIISDAVRRVKVAIISKAIVPDVALIDPVTLTSMPSSLSAATGIDTLTHAIEAYVSNAHSPTTDLLALDAIRLIAEFLVATIECPDDIELRSHVASASFHAGLAFSNAGLGLVHAMAHSLGGHLDLPHGTTNALLLNRVVEFNYPAVPERFARIGKAMGLEMDGKCPDDALTGLIEALEKLCSSTGIPIGLKAAGVDRSDIAELAAKALNDPDIATNPRQPTLDDVKRIYERAL